jgi:hypothetical protein
MTNTVAKAIGTAEEEAAEEEEQQEKIKSDLGANGRVGCSKEKYQPKEVISLSNRVVDP